MAKGSTRKKNRVSKHVLQAQQQRQESATPTSSANSRKSVPSESTPLKPKNQILKAPKSKKVNTKDPIDAASYLSAWKYREETGGTWKFNKNTQSWLIRHMYEADKVNKATFVIMLDYLTGLNDTGKARVVEVAEKRALRYKEYERSLAEKGTQSEPSASESHPGKKDHGENSEIKEVKEDSSDGSQGDDDESRWKRLDGHDKRKEYKRARKILETLQ